MVIAADTLRRSRGLRAIAKSTLWLIAAVVVGCGPRTEHVSSRQNGLVAAWQSSEVAPEQQVDLVNRLIAPGTKDDVAKRLLGPGGVWVHTHGAYVGDLSKDGIIPGNGQLLEEWALEYKTAGRAVRLLFDPLPGKANCEFSFVRAVLVIYGTNLPSGAAGSVD
jgi:hypothetical protein